MQWTERIGRRIKLRDLHILLAVAQAGSMSRAADRLAISHPVVSKTIADLEDALNVRLLDRTSQGTEPTAYGRALLSCGTVVFDELRRGVQEIAFLSDPTVGELRIGSAAPYAEGLVPAVIARLAERYPRIKLHITDTDAGTFVRDAARTQARLRDRPCTGRDFRRGFERRVSVRRAPARGCRHQQLVVAPPQDRPRRTLRRTLADAGIRQHRDGADRGSFSLRRLDAARAANRFQLGHAARAAH